MKTLFLLLVLPTALLAESVSLKNFRELYESLQVAMQLTPSPGDVLTKAFESAHESLPSSSEVGQYNGSMQWALVKLTSEFCRERITKDSKLAVSERWLHKEIDFSAAPQSQDLSSALDDYAAVFWQRLPSAEEKAAISKLLTSVIGESPSDVKSLIPILVALCSTMGSTTDAVTF